MQKIRQLIRGHLQKPIVRYFVMAVFLVVLEVVSFAILNTTLGLNYLLATPASLVLVIFLNWYLGRVFVFTQSKYKAHTEFTLVLVVSLVGMGIQIAVVAFGVEVLNLAPILAKILGIGVTFFWNFFIRQKYIFK